MFIYIKVYMRVYIYMHILTQHKENLSYYKASPVFVTQNVNIEVYLAADG